MTAEPSEPEFNFSRGQRLRLIEGPFTEFVGTGSQRKRQQQKVTVVISSWGKPAPLVFDFLQVEQIEPFFP